MLRDQIHRRKARSSRQRKLRSDFASRSLRRCRQSACGVSHCNQMDIVVGGRAVRGAGTDVKGEVIRAEDSGNWRGCRGRAIAQGNQSKCSATASRREVKRNRSASRGRARRQSIGNKGRSRVARRLNAGDRSSIDTRQRLHRERTRKVPSRRLRRWRNRAACIGRKCDIKVAQR